MLPLSKLLNTPHLLKLHTWFTPTARWEACLSKLLGEDHIMWRLESVPALVDLLSSLLQKVQYAFLPDRRCWGKDYVTPCISINTSSKYYVHWDTNYTMLCYKAYGTWLLCRKNQHKSPSFHFPPGITFRGVSNDHSANSVQVRYRIYISISMIIYLN